MLQAKVNNHQQKIQDNARMNLVQITAHYGAVATERWRTRSNATPMKITRRKAKAGYTPFQP